MMAGIRDGIDFLKKDFWLTFRYSLFLAAGYLLVIPVIRGIAHLDAIQSAQCLSQTFSLMAMILFVPVVAPEMNPDIREIIYSRSWSYAHTVMIRLCLALVMLICMIIGFAYVMKYHGCQFPYGIYVSCTIIYTAILGIMSLFITMLTRHVLAGYLFVISYWSCCQSQIISPDSIYYLFAIVDGRFVVTKVIMTLLLLFLMGIGMIVFLKKDEDSWRIFSL
ncbi:hypothetical protein H6A03_05850 [[Clostridium] spiroforme]|nr:hypothetical protein [Thomasclavelia spiroformis]